MSVIEANAREAAKEAHLLFDAGHFSGACSRAYYAMFNMARALLVSRGCGVNRDGAAEVMASLDAFMRRADEIIAQEAKR